MSARISAAPTPEENSIGPLTAVLFLIAVISGTVWAAVVMPAWLPALTASLLGTDPKAFWYLSRGSAFAAFGLLWLSMALGTMITNKMARAWPGGPTAFELHEFTSLAGIAFTIFHALILLGDQYIRYSIAQILIPFGSTAYEPVWVGLGQVGFYVFGLVTLTFYLRRRIGNRGWRLIHLASYAGFGLALIHGIAAGSDSGAFWAGAVYWCAAGSLLFLLVYRILTTVIKPKAGMHAAR
jgi:predicted ferric reductase